jgi:hypothetical protein
MVPEVNAALTWVAGALVDTKGYMDAAATSAGNAADSANAADTVGGQAVTAAQAARDAAAASALSAQASAEAAGASANFPAFVDGLDVLQVNPTKTGVQWGKVGQSIGDTLITNRPAPAGYVEAGAIYAQAVYPELFALLGIKEVNNDGANWAAYTTTPAASVDFMVSGKDDVIICVANTASSSATGGRAYRSTDSGATWVSIPGLLGKESLGMLACDMLGNWLITTQSNQPNIYTSNDNGVTWVQRAKPYPASYPVTALANGQAGVFVICVTSSTPTSFFYRSTDNGATWTLGVQYNSYTVATSLVSDGNGYWAIGLQLGANQLSLQSYDNFATATANNNIVIPRVGGSGIILASVGGAVTIISDSGSSSIQANGIYLGFSLVDKFGVVYVGTVTVDGITSVVHKSYDRGATWLRAALTLGIAFLVNSTTVTLSNGTWISFYSGVWRKSTRLFNYDNTTQFKVPAIKAPQGFKAYVKAKAA